MSSRVYVDGRTIQLQDCHAIIAQAMEELDARRAADSCGRAEVHTSGLDVSDAVRAFHDARYRDGVEVRSTNELQDKLSRVAPDYSERVLGDWRPDVRAPSIHVDDGVAEGRPDMRIVEDLECAALDGARLLVFEVDDGLGNTSYQIGLETSLFDEEGGWKSDKAKQTYERFLAKAIEAQETRDADLELDPATRAARIGGAMRVAGLSARRKEKIAGDRTATIFTNSGNTADEGKAVGASAKRGFRLGGES